MTSAPDSVPPTAAVLADLGLTWRQTAVFDRLRRRETDPEISQATGLSLEIVQAEVAEVVHKLGLGDRDRAAVFASTYGFTAPLTVAERPTPGPATWSEIPFPRPLVIATRVVVVLAVIWALVMGLGAVPELTIVGSALVSASYTTDDRFKALTWSVRGAGIFFIVTALISAIA